MPGLLGHGQSFKSRDKDCKVCGGRGQVWWGGGGDFTFLLTICCMLCYAMLYATCYSRNLHEMHIAYATFI